MMTAPAMAPFPTPSPGVDNRPNAVRDAIVDFEALLREYEQEEVLDDLAVHVANSFANAEQHRRATNVERDILRSMRAAASEYDPEEAAELDIGPGTDIYLPITELKCRALRSWLHDILANAEDKPWALKPTPDPELSEAAEDAIIEALVDELETTGLGSFDVRERASYYKDLAKKHEARLSERATRRMEDAISDAMTEGDWRTTFSALLSDVSRFPLAIVKGPFLQRTPKLRWKGGRLAQVESLQYRTQRVHPLDIYPSPDMTGFQSGSYVIQRERMTQDKILGLINEPGFDAEAVRAVIARKPSGVSLQQPIDVERDALDAKSEGVQSEPSHTFDVLIYYGLVPANLLVPYGIGEPDPQKYCEAEVWMCDRTVLKAILNPYPLRWRPFVGTAFDKAPGQFWGRSPAMVLRDTQRVANASARALVKNMAFSSGPIGEADVDRIVSESNIEQVEPFRIYQTQNDALGGNNNPALRFQIIPSVARELMGVMERFAKLADDVSGIPAYVVGNPQVAGAGRTLGGLSLLMGNAAKGIKLVISHIDQEVIEPLVRMHYVLMMLLSEDETIKADASVMPRGAAGLLQKELMQARAVEVLNMLTPYAQGGIVPATGLQNVLRDVLRGLGYTADEIIPDPDRKRQLERLARQLNTNAGIPPGAPEPVETPAPRRLGRSRTRSSPVPVINTGPPQPRLDRRSTPRPGLDMLERISANAA